MFFYKFLLILTLLRYTLTEINFGSPPTTPPFTLDIPEGGEISYTVWFSHNFTLDEEMRAIQLAIQARSKFNLAQFRELTKEIRDSFDISFDKYWNCFGGIQGAGDAAGWRGSKYIELVSGSGDGQFFICYQGCSDSTCTTNTRQK